MASETSLVSSAAVIAILAWSILRILCESKRVAVLVVILSARDHAPQRQAIRQTWLNLSAVGLNSSQLIYLFALGRHSCSIPDYFKINPNSCARWQIKSEEVDSLHYLQDHNSCKILISQVGFRVAHPVILHSLGVHAVHNYSVVSVFEPFTGEVFASHTFGQNNYNLTAKYLYSSQDETLLLPKGFEGILSVDKPFPLSSAIISSNAKPLKPNYGPVIVQSVFDPVMNIWTSYDPQIHCLGASFSYTIAERQDLISKLGNLDAIEHEWFRSLEKQDRDLEAEQREHGDLLFLDVHDVYANLPLKLHRFFQWLSTSNIDYQWLVKADDDTLIDVRRLYRTIQETRPRADVWWGQFRVGWSVQPAGKWMELAYPGPSYPAFACGTAHLLGSELVSQLSAMNVRYLQGEDVSLGTWMAAISSRYLNDPLWCCTKNCPSQSYSIGQLSIEEMFHHWSQCNKQYA